MFVVHTDVWFLRLEYCGVAWISVNPAARSGCDPVWRTGPNRAVCAFRL